MHVIVNRKQLILAMDAIIGFASGKMGFDIGRMFMVSTCKDRIVMVATDLESTGITTVKAEIKETGSACIEAQRMRAVAQKYPGDAMAIVKEKNGIRIQTGATRFNLAYTGTDIFPNPPEIGNAFMAVDGEILEKAFKKLLMVGSSDPRPHVAGVRMYSGENGIITCLSTDGGRLVRYRVPVLEGESFEIDRLVPKRAMAEARKSFFGRVEIGVKGAHFIFKNGQDGLERVICARTYEGAFPGIEKLISDEGYPCLVDRLELLAAMERMAIFLTPEISGANFIFKKNQIKIVVVAPDAGESDEKITVEYTGPDMEIVFNLKYMIDYMAKIVDKKITMTIQGPRQACRLRSALDQNYDFVIMPMRQVGEQ